MRRVLAALLATAVLAAPAAASDDESRPLVPEEVQAAVGSYNFGHGEPSAGVGLEARFRAWLVRDRGRNRVALLPAGGVAGTSRNAILAFAGLRLAWDLAGRWRVVPGFAVTAYAGNGDINLGGSLEFLSSLEVTRGLGNGVRLGAAVYHLSNAHLYPRNPGANSLALVVAF